MADSQQKIGSDSPHGQVAFAWSFPEFPHYRRDRQWYIGAAIVVGLLLVYAAFVRNFLFGILIILITLTVALVRRNSRPVEFAITTNGVVVNGRFYPYDDILNFYIIYQPPVVKTLYFELKGFFSPRIPVSLENQDPVAIRQFLLQYLPEDLERENEPTSDQFSRLLKL